MAKANTPSSRGKKTPQTSRGDAGKPDEVKDDPKAASTSDDAKGDSKVHAKTDKASDKAKDDGADKAKSEAASAEKPTAAKDDKPASPSKASAAAAGVSAKVAAEAKKDDTSAKKGAAAASDDAKPGVADKAAVTTEKSAGSTKVADKKTEPPAASAAATGPSASAGSTASESRTAPQRSIFWPLVTGGVIAGVLGFAASEMNVLNTRVGTEGMEQALDAQAERIAALEAAEPTVPEAPDLSGIEAALDEVSGQVAALEERLSALEDRPVPVVTGDDGEAAQYAETLAALRASVEAQKADIDAQKAEIDAQKDEIETLIANAQSVEEATANAARNAAAQTALAKVTAAVSSGASYQMAVEELSESGIEDIPEALEENAADGVPALLALQSDFPGAARAALAASRAAGSDGGESGFGGFLRRQLGARSVAPREGSDPDAVLSRAEAAVREGRIGDALNELETLPPEAAAAMDDWIARARTRADAEAAVQALSQRLSAN